MQDESALPTALRTKLPPMLEKIKNGHYNKEDYDYPIHIYLKENDIKVDETGSDIINFLRGKSILVTGATGFLGKLLVEKLLRCCKDIGTIYIMVRTKNQKDPQDRVKEYLDNWVFIKLSRIDPNFRDKVKGISGDFEQDHLGLSEESRNILKEKVNIIYHVAATVRFDEKLKKAVKINVEGTREIIKLAKECKNLDVLTYVSTAYSNCIFKEIKEEIYSPAFDPQALIEIANKFPSDFVDTLTPGLLGKCPNTYVLTKHIAEQIVLQEAIGMPVCIQRPSVIIGTVREPVRFWIDNIFGPTGVTVGVGLGLIHTMWCQENYRCDLIPADYVINHCIAASYKTFTDRLTDQVQVFNCTTSSDNPITYKNYIHFTGKYGVKVGCTKIFMKFFLRTTSNWYVFMFSRFFVHTLKGYVLDFIAASLGRKPRLTKTYKKIHRFMAFYSTFWIKEWTFELTNTHKLWSSLNEKDKAIFPFDMRTLNWEEYFVNAWTAIRELLMLDFLDNLEEGRSHQRRLIVIQYSVVSTILALTIYFLTDTVFCFIPVILIILIIYYKNVFQ